MTEFKNKNFWCAVCRRSIAREFLLSHQNKEHLMLFKMFKSAVMRCRFQMVRSRLENVRDAEERQIAALIGNFPLLKHWKVIRMLIDHETESANHRNRKLTFLQWKWEIDKARATTIAELNASIGEIITELETLNSVRPFRLRFTKKQGLSVSACPGNSTVTAANTAYINKPNMFIITVRDKLNNIVDDVIKYKLTIVLVDSDDNPVNLTVEKKRHGLYVVKYCPTRLGSYKLLAAVDSVPVRGAPHVINVVNPPRPEFHKTTFGESGIGNGQFSRPWGICCDGYGRIYVADRCNNRIQVFRENGKFLRAFGKKGSKPGELNLPAGIAVDPYQRVVVTDKDNHRVQIFLSNGEYCLHFGQERLNYPWGVAVNEQCQIAVTEGLKNRVTLFNDCGVPLIEAVFGDEMGVEYPRGIAALPNGSFLVTDFNQHKLVLLSDKLRPVATLGSFGSNAEQFFRPQAVAVSRDGRIAVSDSKNDRLKIYKAGKNNSFFFPDLIIDDFAHSQGISFLRDGTLVSVDSTDHLVGVFRFSERKIYPSDEIFADATDYDPDNDGHQKE